MNLAGNQAKQLFKTLRIGGRPPTVALWAAATVVDQIRKRERPARELLASKKLKPGESYVIRVPGPDDEPLSAPNGLVAVTQPSEGSIGSQLVAAATDLIGAATESVAEDTSLSRRQRRKAEKEATAEPSVSSTLMDVAASFLEPDEAGDEPEEAAERPQLGRRARRRAGRLAALDDFEIDRQTLPRRRRRKLKRAEKRARRRPSRRRIRKARRQQKRATSVTTTLERKAGPSRRRRRELQAAEREVDFRAAKVEKRSTRNRLRKLRKAEKELSRLS